MLGSNAQEVDGLDELDSPLFPDSNINTRPAYITNFDRQPYRAGDGLPNLAITDLEKPRTVIIGGVEREVPDVNTYQHKKTLAQGMMDLALISANANQLRYVLDSYGIHPYFYPSVIFISISIVFQIAVGVGLILISKYNVRCERGMCKANRLNDFTTIGIFIITVLNVLVSAFGVVDSSVIGKIH